LRPRLLALFRPPFPDHRLVCPAAKCASSTERHVHYSLTFKLSVLPALYACSVAIGDYQIVKHPIFVVKAFMPGFFLPEILPNVPLPT
jgi:hypothetical protein